MSLQILINGLATGSVYALIATGFALIFNVFEIFQLSHGATMTAAAFVAYFLVSSKDGTHRYPGCRCGRGRRHCALRRIFGFRRSL
ncbi:MAG: hypothetical protein ACLSBB_16510 [Ruthenibacterium lactatiformans]